jgi:phospho-N-acetylmuramoyl-pentapeptide-transferase
VLRLGHVKFSQYLNVLYLPGSGELTVFCARSSAPRSASCGSTAIRPTCSWATRARSRWAARSATVAVLIKKEFLLVVGGVFVAEALSVIIQVASFKLTGKRVFKMSPLHHHFELSGWAESRVVARFWIVAALLALVTLSTLKLQ